MRGILVTGIAGAVFALAGCSGLNADNADNESAPASEASVASIAETGPAKANEQQDKGQHDRGQHDKTEQGQVQQGQAAAGGKNASNAASANGAAGEAGAPAPDPQARGQCGEPDAHAAVAANVGQLAPNLEWNPDTAIADYDPCADLSWAAVTVTGATASSPYHIMLFHKGEFLGTATAQPYGFAPEINRASGRQMDVIYRWPQDGDANANPTGSSFASFAWNPVTEEIEMAGNVPPA
ncbi:LppP/LprE family lipoprotein [Corynebacterium sp. HMSC04H06]|uniref:LppP/LprE family lipoprotein n=1 Tax=Corynebacterium sp. HMSC04H06 TaxID=1581050 RepID=UPI00143A9890|nr:LppP/LprE family lipoprotein [Corynebacterium sp. HMSC04H06]